jgi:hypothetical protein
MGAPWLFGKRNGNLLATVIHGSPIPNARFEFLAGAWNVPIGGANKSLPN